MKKIFLFYGLVLAAFSCEDYLDVKPSDFLPASEYYQSLGDLQIALNGAYTVFEDGLGGADLVLATDIMTDNALYQGAGFSYLEISQNQISPSNGTVLSCWLSGYNCINQVNIILASLENLQERPTEAAVRSQIRGEALFLRGVIYFELVRLFGKPYGPSSLTDLGVPLLDQATTKLSQVTYPSRATVAEAYDRAMEDLKKAQELLTPSGKRGFANRYAASGYLAKIAFQQRQYEAAANYAKEVINGPYKLTAEPKLFFSSEGSTEEIWSMVHGTQGSTRGPLAAFTQPASGTTVRLRLDIIDNGFSRIIPPTQLAALQMANNKAVDLRRTTMTFSLPGGNAFGSSKYDDYAGAGDDAPLLRLAEILLIRAEALARTTGINQESIDLLNSIRSRSLRVQDGSGVIIPSGSALIQYKLSDFSTAEELIEAIILERRVELVLEGNYFHDLMRLQRNVKNFPFDSDLLRWPIPQREIDANENLIQNPGYQ